MLDTIPLHESTSSIARPPCLFGVAELAPMRTDETMDAGMVAPKTVGPAAAQIPLHLIIEGVRFQSMEELTQYLIARLNDEHAEILLTLFLDCEGSVVAESASLSVYCPFDVMRRCRELDATNIIVAHKTPGGSMRPSLADIILTKTLVEAADAMDVYMADYIIVGCGQYFSFDEKRLLIDPPSVRGIVLPGVV